MTSTQVTHESVPIRGDFTARWITRILAVVILVPSLWGFGSKFIEFVTLARGDVAGAFAITPVLNYLLASLGFLCLLGWAALHGMFRDIERPKVAFLENERRLDADDPRAIFHRSSPSS